MCNSNIYSYGDNIELFDNKHDVKDKVSKLFLYVYI